MTEARAHRPAEGRVWQLTALMAAVAVALGAVAVTGHLGSAAPTMVWWLLLPAFALAEIVVIHFPAQRSSHSHTFREIPAIVGLTLLPVPQYLSVYVVGGALAVLLWSRLRGVKLAFNVSMFAVEAVLGSLVYDGVLSGADPIGLRGWAAAVAAVLLTDLVTAAAVTAAISLTDGAFDGHVLREALRSGVAAAVVNSCVSLLVVTLLVTRPMALPLLGVIAVMCLLGYRLYVGLSREHARMRLLYRFVGSTGHVAQLDEVLPAVLSEAAHLLHADRARLVAFDAPGSDGDPRRSDGPTDPHHGSRAWTWAEGALTEERLDPDADEVAWWSGARDDGPVLLTAQDAGGRRDPEAPRDGVAVPMLEAGVVTGVLMVFDRAFEQETFSEPDVRVLETMAAHASVALDKSRAVERLRRFAEERAFAASHDQLTGLPNRRALQEAVEDAMGGGRHGAVLLLDLDDFKDVNDTLGHSAGDALLTVTGERLAAESAGVVARLGGDEFAVLLPGTDTAVARACAVRLQEVVSTPVPLAGAEIVTATSIGVAAFEGASCTAEELLAHAEVALYAAKTARTGIEDYRPEDGHSTARRLALAADLPAALAEDRVELYYQPQADSRTGVVTGFEALLRWDHPRFGMVPPPEVVAVAQRTGLMAALSARLVERALLERREWCRAGHELDVAVNITPGDLETPALAERVAALLAQTRTPPGALVLEITESDALADPERSTVVLRQLAACGVRLSIDDFGTGYSSLAYLDQLPVHEVKIDQSFVFRLERGERPTIVRATVGLAHDLGLRVVAEGVESDLSRRLVTDLGCDLVQGYGISRPMPARDVVGWLDRRALVTSAARDRLPSLA